MSKNKKKNCVSDGGSITWYEPPPVHTVTDKSNVSAASRSLIKGFPNEELSCNFSLTANLSVITVLLKFGESLVAAFVPSQQAPTVSQGYQSRLNATWVPNKLSLIFFNITDADQGKYTCEVISVGGSAQTWTRTIEVSLLGKVGQCTETWKVTFMRIIQAVIL